MNWSTYLSQGAPRIVYHMCDKDIFNSMTINENDLYYPKTFVEDGNFIHATAFPKDLIDCGNHFYKQVPGEWICIALNPQLLDAEVKYETAAPVGNIETFDTTGMPKFPHIYGGISKKAIIKTYKIIRDNGEFLSILGLC